LTAKLRITEAAADDLRAAIVEVDGREIFAIGDVEAGVVTGVSIVARGQADRVLATIDRPRKGQVVLHNHPSGVLQPSDADLALAHRFGEQGVGFVIVDNPVRRSEWTVEPFDGAEVDVDADEVRAFFEVALPAVLPGWEPRAAQTAMAEQVLRSLNTRRHLVVEAGTGTGKSLAYLAPAALWATANNARVVVATHTRALQSQIATSDAPMLARAGLPAKVALLQGRANYLCKRRAALAGADLGSDPDPEDETIHQLRAILDWSALTATGSRAELTIKLGADVWERVESDSDLTLRHRCEHYDTCHFYSARRAAADAQVLVVNHALLLTDLSIRQQGGAGILPKYERVILDEAQHLEDVATGALSARVTPLGVRRAFALLSRRNGPLTALPRAVAATPGVDDETREAVRRACEDAQDLVAPLGFAAEAAFEGLSPFLDPQAPTLRLDRVAPEDELWSLHVAPQVRALIGALTRIAAAADAVRGAMGDAKLPETLAQPSLDLGRAIRRIGTQVQSLQAFLEPGTERCRWLEAQRSRRGLGDVAICSAPIEVADTLRDVLWEAVPGVVATSATIAVGQDFGFWRRQVGLDRAEEAVHASPFQHHEQAVLALPRDLPAPDTSGWDEASARLLIAAVRCSRGGAFVLCTSFVAVDRYADALRRAFPNATILAQGDQPRAVLLERFRDIPNAILVGTDSFWEGVSVRGDALRLVVIPKIPFRVPTEPLQQARQERIVARGGDAFRALTLPQAAIKLRQGYGRLIRSTTDRGVVLLLDPRLHDKPYGRVLLAALPPARRVQGDSARIVHALRAFYTPDNPAE
jgi:ATP-dependent DNA helicase DinG